MDDVDYARRFEVEHAHYTEDLDFWRGAARRLGSPVLDLGSATGRVARALGRDGAEVWALDGSVAMLDQLAHRLDSEPPEVRARIHTVRADLRDFALDRRFPLILIAMNTLQALTEPEDRLACLRTVRRHLAAGGELVFDVALPDAEEIVEAIGVAQPSGSHRDEASGTTVLHTGWYEAFDSGTGTLEYTMRVEDRSDDGRRAVRLRRHIVHLFPPDELHALLARAGLSSVQAMGDFGGGPLWPGSERQIHRCVAAEGSA